MKSMHFHDSKLKLVKALLFCSFHEIEAPTAGFRLAFICGRAYYFSSSNTDPFFIAAATPKKNQIIINSMKNGKAIGPYCIPVYLLKIRSEYIAVPLCDIIHDSFSSGIIFLI